MTSTPRARDEMSELSFMSGSEAEGEVRPLLFRAGLCHCPTSCPALRACTGKIQAGAHRCMQLQIEVVPMYITQTQPYHKTASYQCSLSRGVAQT